MDGDLFAPCDTIKLKIFLRKLNYDVGNQYFRKLFKIMSTDSLSDYHILRLANI